MKLHLTGFALTTVLLATAHTADAALLAEYEINAGFNTSIDDPLNAATELAGVDATALAETGFTTKGSTIFVSSPRSRYNDSGVIDNDGSDMLSFTLTPNAAEDANAQALDINTVTIWVQGDNMADGSVINVKLSIDDLSNAAGFVDISTQVYTVAGGTTMANAADYRQLTFTLGSVADLLTAGAELKFTFYDPQDEISGTSRFRFDQIEVNGETVLPEPASLALLGLGGLMIARRRG